MVIYNSRPWGARCCDINRRDVLGDSFVGRSSTLRAAASMTSPSPLCMLSLGRSQRLFPAVTGSQFRTGHRSALISKSRNRAPT